MHPIRLSLLTAAAAVIALPVLAQDHSAALAARQGQMNIMALNLGVLGGMARGKVDYDAAKAQAAADNLVTVSMIDQSFSWPAGSDNAALDTTRALPAIWENIGDVVSKMDSFGMAAKGLQDVAANGAEGLGPAVGAVGATCGACHKPYRGPELK